MHSLAEAALVDVGSVETDGGQHVRIHGGAESEMTADADAENTQAAVGIGAGFQVVERGAGIGIVGGDFLGNLVGIAFIGPGRIVRNYGTGGLKFVVDLGHRNGVAGARNLGCRTANGAGNLKDFRNQ